MWRRLFKDLFREHYRLTIPSRPARLPACRFRPLQEQDFERCVEIYRLNEPGRFPDGYLEDFTAWLTDGERLALVCEVDGEVRSVGGVSSQLQGEAQLCFFSYGMVHPAFHGQGYGTASLLARIVSLEVPTWRWHGILTTVGGSETFYKRFGFGFLDRYVAERGEEFSRYLVRIYPDGREACRKVLAKSGVVVDLGGAAVPLVKEKSTGGATTGQDG